MGADAVRLAASAQSFLALRRPDEQRRLCSPPCRTYSVTLVSRPAVSVIVPTYDRANLLADAIESICAQGVGDLEIVVVDDGSSDGTESLLASLDAPIRYLR